MNFNEYYAEGKYFPETEADGYPFDLMTEEDERRHAHLVRGIHDGSIKIKVEPEIKD